MKVKVSVRLSRDLLRETDALRGSLNRPEFVEAGSVALIRKAARQERDAMDLEILNRHAERLNAEALDVLRYRVTK